METTIKNKFTKEEVWVKVIVAYTNADNAVSVELGIKWADKVADAHESRFKFQ